MFSTRHDSTEDLVRNCRSEATSIADFAEMLFDYTRIKVAIKLLGKLSIRQLAIYLNRRIAEQNGEPRPVSEWWGETYW